MNLKCMVKHDWVVLKSATAAAICFEYLLTHPDRKQEFIKVNNLDLRIEVGVKNNTINWNFINCPYYIEFEDKVCLECKKIRMNYTRITGLLDKEFDLYLHYKKHDITNSSRLAICKLEEKMERRVTRAKEILEEFKLNK